MDIGRLSIPKGRPDKEIIMQFDEIGINTKMYEQEWQIPFKNYGRWGTVAYNGRVPIPAEYDTIFYYGPGYVITRRFGKLGAGLNHNGDTYVIPARYAAIGSPSASYGQTLLPVKAINGRWGWVDRFGNEYFRD